MGKAGDLVGPIFCVIGVVFVIQLPLFIAISKLVQLKRQENILISDAAAAGQALLLGSVNIARPPLSAEIGSSPVSSSCSQGTDCPKATTAAAVSGTEETRIRSDDAAFKPLSFANHPFVLFSVYRHTLNTFYVLGITSVIVRKYENEQPVYRCEWIPRNESLHIGGGSSDGADQQEEEALVTEAKALYVDMDENGMLYVPAIINCTFNQSVGAAGEGGLLRLDLSRGPSFWGPHYAVEDVFREKPGETASERSKSWLLQQGHNKSESSSLMEPDLPYKYAFCGPPLYGTAHNTDWIPKWLAYHHYLWEGKAHFYFYLAEALNTEARQMLAPWITAGLLTIIEAAGGEAYPSWYRNQVLFINDCIYRTRFTARWTFFHDLDELLYVPAPNTLPGLLEEHRDKPWMTFGNLPFSIDHCIPSIQRHQISERQQFGRELWHLERMLWRTNRPECMHEDENPWMCIAAPGRRKYVVNPRKVFVSGVHRVAMPEDGGLNFNASVARVHHFHGITNPQTKACNRLLNISGDSKQPDPLSYEFDDAMASLMPRVRKFAGPLL